MTDFGQMGFTEAQIDMLNVAEGFCRDKSPIETVRALMTEPLGYNPDTWAEIGALGWLAIAIPEAYDGVGLSLTEVVPVAEQMGRRMMHTPFVSTTLAAQAVITGGTEAQKAEYLPKIAAGTAATLALSETNGDWDLANIDSTASRNSDGGFTLSGTKVFVMDLHAAEFVIISAMLDGAPALFLIEAASIAQDNRRRETLIDETKRGFEVTLDGIRMPETALMDTAKTEETLARIHLAANLLNAAELTGACQSCIEYTVEYLGTRKQFGKLIGSFQALKHPTVDAFVDYQKSRSLLYAAAYSFERQGEGEIATRMAKTKAETSLSFAADRSIQFHGGFGFTYDCDAQLYRRRAIFLASQHGDARYHKQKLADLLL